MSISSRRSWLRVFSNRSGRVSGIWVSLPRVSVEVRPVTSRRDLTRFIKLPWRLYRNEPNWVPPLLRERRQFLDRKRNPFFEHTDAELFLAWRDGQPVGRISAHIDHTFNEVPSNDWGLLGCFEAENDPAGAGALRPRAGDWLAERGRDRMV